MTRLSRENFLITGFVCIFFGASMSVANLGPMALTVGLFGIVFFIVGMSMNVRSVFHPKPSLDGNLRVKRCAMRVASCTGLTSLSTSPFARPFCAVLAVTACSRRLKTVLVYLPKLRCSVVGRRGVIGVFVPLH